MSSAQMAAVLSKLDDLQSQVDLMGTGCHVACLGPLLLALHSWRPARSAD